ncbi:MAG: septum formation initiator family protein [Gemmatimonadota bacterium]|nr:septum formation initiator family protein [Gemmatimonadota bacterium]MDE2872242.1 septum formation initiator family protein [Gemmatimonadota bacterium]
MRRWRRIVFPGVLGLALYVGVAGGEYSLLEARRAASELLDTSGELQIARQRNESLRARIDSLLHHDGALERFARERYGLIRDGELLYRISPGLEPEETVAPDERDGTSVLGRLRRGLRSDRSR